MDQSFLGYVINKCQLGYLDLILSGILGIIECFISQLEQFLDRKVDGAFVASESNRAGDMECFVSIRCLEFHLPEFFEKTGQ